MSGKQTLTKAMGGGRFRSPISDEKNVKGRDMAQTFNFRVRILLTS
jgi:hypothetical protein